MGETEENEWMERDASSLSLSGSLSEWLLPLVYQSLPLLPVSLLSPSVSAKMNCNYEIATRNWPVLPLSSVPSPQFDKSPLLTSNGLHVPKRNKPTKRPFCAIPV